MPRPPQPRTIGSEDSLARRIEREREKRGWSPASLAERMTKAGCPMSQSAIWKIAKGEPRRRITVDEAVAFANVFDVPLEDLLVDPEVAADEEAVRILRHLTYLTESFEDTSKAIKDAWADLTNVIGSVTVERMRENDMRWSRMFAEMHFREGMSRDELHTMLENMIDQMATKQDEAYARVIPLRTAKGPDGHA